MKNYLKFSLYSLIFTGLAFAFTACQTESFLDEEDISVSNELPEAESAVALTISSQKLIAVKNIFHGTYLSDENGGIVNTNRTEIGTWERITLVTWSDGSVSFKGHNNKFLTDENGSHDIRFNRTNAGPWERFDLITSNEIDGYFIIRAGETTNTGHNYLFLKTNSYFGIGYEREDAAYEFIDL